MPSTSLHLPPALVSRLDALAARTGKSRNSLIVEACRTLLDRDLGEWPAEFFSNDRLSGRDLADLKAGASEMLREIHAARKSRRRSPL